MNRSSFILIIFLVINLFCGTNIKSQTNDVVADKVIISGKTYYLHVVQKGEGFYGIAKKYGVSQKEIHEANPDAIFGLKPGDVLYIPVIEGRNSNVSEVEASGEFIYHTIQKGQTLFYLSQKYNITVEEIKRNNPGSDKELLIGTIFKIPVLKESDKQENNFVYHTVQAKETLYGISKRYNTSVKSIIENNPALKNGILPVGSKLRIEKSIEPAKIAVKDKQEQAIEDEQYLYHRIISGETVYSLSKKYDLPQEELERHNPDLNPSELPLGFMVRIPKDQINSSSKNKKDSEKADFIVHVMKRKETVYSIAKKYGVTVQQIQDANPTKILSNVKKGTKIKVPTLEYLALKKDQERLNELNKIDKDKKRYFDTIQVNCDEYDYYLYNDMIKVAVLLPFDVEATRKVNIIKKIEGEEEIEVDREGPVVSSRSRVFAEFYEGVLMAVDSLKKQGANITLFTYDTAPDTNKVIQILNRPELKTVDFIIGPAYGSNLKLVSDFSVKNSIKMIYPLSSVNPELNHNPYSFQVNPPDSMLFQNYSDYIGGLQNERNRVLVLKSAEPLHQEEQLVNEIKNKIFLKNLSLGIVPDFKEISFSAKDVQGIKALLSEDKENIVVIPSPEEADVSKIITTLHGVVESSDIKIRLIGFGSWLRYQTINPEAIHDLNTQILTSYALDHSDPSVKNFAYKYRQWFKCEPYAVGPYFIRSNKNANYSRYGIWGFDVAYYFFRAYMKYGSDFEYCIDQFQDQQVQFNFNFKRSSNWGGFYNQGLNILGFTPSLDVYRTPLN